MYERRKELEQAMYDAAIYGTGFLRQNSSNEPNKR